MSFAVYLKQYESKTLTSGENAFTYRAYEHIPYVSAPVVPEYQQLSIYVPEGYYEGKTINGYDLNTAPVFMPNTVGGYMPGPVETPGVNDKGEPNTMARALLRGYVVVSAGARGRGMQDAEGNNIGVAPAAICDLKAAVRFLRYHAKELPGDVEKIITNGTSAGGGELASLVQIYCEKSPAQKKKRGLKMKNKVITVLAIIAAALVILLIQFGPLGLILLSATGAKIEEYSDVSEYNRFMGENADEEYRNKWDMDETIFPASITEDMNVQDYKKYIKEEYLPVGFDATSGNPYEEKIRAEQDDSFF